MSQQPAVQPQVVHQGRNRTCCWGKCFVNSEPFRCFVTILMINVPVVATILLTFKEIFIEGFPDEEAFIWMTLIVFLIYLDAATNYNMMACAMTDPGIVPARRWPEYMASKYNAPTNRSEFYTQV